MSAEQPTLLASIKRHLPDTWGRVCSGTPHCIGLGPHSYEYFEVHSHFKNTLPYVEPKKIIRVENAFLYGMYQLKKAEYLATNPLTLELDLWHATSVANCKSIVKTNLNWRLATRIKFGRGVSFSPSAKYADDQCNRANPMARASIRCKVLVGRATGGCATTVLPKNGNDTTTGNGNLVYVKYADYEFYPEYVVYYDSPRIDQRNLGAWGYY